MFGLICIEGNALPHWKRCCNDNHKQAGVVSNMNDAWEHVPNGLKHAVDLLSIATLLGSLVSMLPAVASVLTIIWTLIRIFETATVQRILGKKP